MRVNKLIKLLNECNPDAIVEARYRGSTWTYSPEDGSVEVDTCEWGAVEGVTESNKKQRVFIYAISDDANDFYPD